MTCIIGMAKDGKVYMGGDSMASAGHNVRIQREKKVFPVGEFLIGTSGSIRGANLLKHKFSVPVNNGKDDFKYMVTEFVPAVRELFKDGGLSKIDNNVEEAESHLLVGYRGVIYNFFGDFQIDVYEEEFTATGCGKYYALGAMEGLGYNIDREPKETIIKALEIVGKYDAYVGAPYYVLEL